MRFPTRSAMRPACIVLAVCLLGWTAFVASVQATGTQTGVVAGTVTDTDGVLLQGVEVRLQGLQGARRSITDAEGRFRFPALGVGAYTLSAELLELQDEQDVTVFVGRTSDARLVLRAPDQAPEPRVEDWIQVVGEAPLVDRFDTRLGADLSFEFLDDLPVERFYQSFALLLPGVTGGEDGNPNTSGALRSANLFLVDGVDTTDPTTGLFGLNLNYEAVQEVQVTTGASGVEFGRASGAVINVVTRSGGPRWTGLLRWTGGGDDFASPYQEKEDRRNLLREIRGANSGRADLDSTVSLSLGGPILQERLWGFLSYQDSDVGFLRPTLLGDPWDAASDIETQAIKLNWQPDSRHRVELQYSADDSRFTTFQPFSSGPAELQLPDVPDADMLSNSFFQTVPGEQFALEDRRQEGNFSKLQWNVVAGQNVAWSMTLADQERSLVRGALQRRGLTSDAPHVGAFFDSVDDLDNLDDAELRLFVFNGVTEEGTEERPRQQANASVEVLQRWRGVEQEFRFGVDFQETESRVDIQVPGADGIDPLTGLPSSGQLYIDFDLRPECLFLNVCRPFNPASGGFQTVGVFNFYTRPAHQSEERITAAYLSDTLVLDRWVIYLGARWETIEGEDGAGRPLVDDSDLAPRLAVTYSLGEQRNGVLSASWGRYYESFLHQYLDAFQRLEPLSGFTEYERRDRVGNFDCSTFDVTDLSHPCWQPSGVNAPFSLLQADPSTGLERSSVDEWTLGFEYQITSGAGFEAHWVDRSWDDLWTGVGRLVGEDAVVYEMANLPQAERTYRALQVLYRQRLDRWQLLASYTWSEAEGNLFRDDGLDDLGSFFRVIDTNVVNRFGPAPYDRPHQAGLFTTYEVPVGETRLTLGSSLQYRDGVPFHLTRLEEAGERFVTPRGSERLSGVWQWDLAARLDLELAAGIEMELRAEASNLTDEQEQIGAETLLDSGLASRPASLDDLQTPRTYRFTLGLKF